MTRRKKQAAFKQSLGSLKFDDLGWTTAKLVIHESWLEYFRKSDKEQYAGTNTCHEAYSMIIYQCGFLSRFKLSQIINLLTLLKRDKAKQKFIHLNRNINSKWI